TRIRCSSSQLTLLQMYHFFVGFSFSKTEIQWRFVVFYFFSVLFKFLILIPEIYPTDTEAKTIPDACSPARYKAARCEESGKGRCRRPLAALPREFVAPAAAARTRGRDPRQPARPQHSAARRPASPRAPSSLQRWGGGRGGEPGRPRWPHRAHPQRRPRGKELREKGVNPEVHRPPASQRQPRGNKSGP
ncbi:Hypothetical predicted protein, partial [Marmota monax]